MARAAEVDGRHLLAVSNKFIMWDIGTGEIVREIDPHIDGSIMKKVCISSNGRYAVAHTSDDAVIVLDVHTQHVVKLDKTRMSQWLDPLGVHEANAIIGLDLIGSAGRFRNAKRFVVWTSSSIFIMRIDSGEVSPVGCDSGGTLRRSKSESIQVDLDYLVDSESMGFDYGHIVEVKLIPGDLILVLYKDNGKSGQSSDSTINLITLAHDYNSSSDSYHEWFQRIDCTSISWDPHATQLVFSDMQGNIWLARRRKTCWSRWKLLAAAKELKTEPANASKNNSNKRSTAAHAPFSIELTSHSASSCGGSLDNLDEIDQLDPAEREELLEFERQVDDMRAEGVVRSLADCPIVGAR